MKDIKRRCNLIVDLSKVFCSTLTNKLGKKKKEREGEDKFKSWMAPNASFSIMIIPSSRSFPLLKPTPFFVLVDE